MALIAGRNTTNLSKYCSKSELKKNLKTQWRVAANKLLRKHDIES